MPLVSMPRVERLHLSDVVLPEGHPEATRGRSAVVFGFVIDHPDGAIVVDTGVGRGNPFIDDVYSPTVVNLERALDEAGIEPSSVIAVVNSHLHFDHCGQNPLYYGSRVPVFVQAEEVEAARGRYYTVSEWATVPTDQLRTVRGDERRTGVLLCDPELTAGAHRRRSRSSREVAMSSSSRRRACGTSRSSVARKRARRTWTRVSFERLRLRR